jgi:hypothetical protein
VKKLTISGTISSKDARVYADGEAIGKNSKIISASEFMGVSSYIFEVELDIEKILNPAMYTRRAKMMLIATELWESIKDDIKSKGITPTSVAVEGTSFIVTAGDKKIIYKLGYEVTEC